MIANSLERVEQTTPWGQAERYSLDRDIFVNLEYHPEKHKLTHILTTCGENILQNLRYDYDGFSNLASRKDEERDMEDTFTYDHLNRLTGIWRNSFRTGWMDYDAYGHMTRKVVDNLLVFTNAVYDETAKPHAIDRADTDLQVFAEHAISYTSFDKVKHVEQDGNTLDYTYGYDRQRIFMEEHVGSTTRTKRYIGNCELVTVTTDEGTTSEWHTYLIGPTGVYAVVTTDTEGTHTIHYVLKDNLGSWTTITDRHGNIEQELSYDAWGTLRDPETWLNYPTDEPTVALMFDRGFTGHEHMTTFGLINMNGRCYDPLTSSFLSVDAYVQSPDNAQSFNRYAYCQNNPLRYVDPSGWYMQGASYGTPVTGSSWGESYSQHAYEPRELGMLQLPENKVMTWWMEGETMLGGGGGGGGNDGGSGAWYVLKGIRNFEILNQDDGWNNPKKCKYVCLEMIEKWFLGEGARSAKELQEIAEEKDNKYDKYDLLYLYNKLSAGYYVEYIDDNTTTAIVQSINEGCPIIMGMERFDSYGNIICGHAVVIVGIYIDDNGYELKVADPGYQDNSFTHITSSEIAKEHIRNNVGLEMIKFKPY